MKVKLWVIVDVSEKENVRLCYADEKKTKGAMAFYDRKPRIQAHWKQFKKAIQVEVEIPQQ